MVIRVSLPVTLEVLATAEDWKKTLACVFLMPAREVWLWSCPGPRKPAVPSIVACGTYEGSYPPERQHFPAVTISNK